MIKKDQIFELKLEDYSYPRRMSAVKSYYGTMDEIIELMIRMEDDPHVCARYKETLDAAEFYDLDNEVTHTVAGQTLPVFTPVREISCLETSFPYKEWTYKGYNGALYPCYATNVDVRQSLIQTATGYELCIQANITDLRVCYTGVGWVCPNVVMKGFPGMVTYGDNTHRMALATSQKHYDFDELELAMADAMNPNSIHWPCLVVDILAEG
ncbi:MAG: hypothetical protein J6R05_05070 [Bacteroidaceae bacterium]|nr:hypothetical protein [Bacteroidaceae bacterium]